MPPQVLVVCKRDRELVSLDPASLVVRWRSGLSDIGHEVVPSEDGERAYVPLYGTGGVSRPGRSGNGIDVVDLEHGVRVDLVPLPRGSRPHFAAWGCDGRLFVTAEGIRSVLSVDVAAWERTPGDLRHVSVPPHQVLRTAHPQSHMLAVAPDGRHVYTADVHPGTVTELEVTSGTRRSLYLAERINRISLSADGRTAYVADQDEPRLAVVDVLSLSLDRWITLPGIAFGTAASGAGRLIVAMRQAGQLAILDTEAGRVLRSVGVPDGPQRVVMSGEGRTVYTTCSPADLVVAVDIDRMQVVAEGEPGGDPDGLAVVG